MSALEAMRRSDSTTWSPAWPPVRVAVRVCRPGSRSHSRTKLPLLPVPADGQVLPIELVPAGTSLDELIGVGLMNRPELAESRALVAAALARWRQDRTRPLLPSVQMAFYGGQFGGGLPGQHNFSDREDFAIQANWELRNGGWHHWVWLIVIGTGSGRTLRDNRYASPW